MATTFTVQAQFQAVDHFSSKVKQMQKATMTFSQRASANIAKVDRQLRKLTPSISALGKQMIAMGVSMALFAGVSSAVNTVKDFEQANANLAAVLQKTREEIKPLTESAKALGKTTEWSASEVTGLQDAYSRLGYEQENIIKVQGATLEGATALQAGLQESAELVGGTLRAYGEGADQAQRYVDVLAKSTATSALNFEKLATSLPIVGKTADVAGVSFERTAAQLGILSNNNIDASTSGSALRNIYLDLAKKGLTYDQAMAKINGSTNKLNTANELFGKRGATVALTLSTNIKNVDSLEKKLKNASGTAKEMAEKQLNTLEGSLKILNSAWEGAVIDVANNTEAMSNLKKVVRFLSDNLTTILKVLGLVAAAFVVLKTVIWASRTAMLAYNIIMGISAALTGTLTASLATNTAAQSAFAIASKVITGATWLWSAAQTALNAVLWANPIGIIIGIIVILIAAITYVIKKTDGWGKQWDITINGMKASWELFTLSFIHTGQVISDKWHDITESIVRKWQWGQYKMGLMSEVEYKKEIFRSHVQAIQRKGEIMKTTNAMVEAKRKMDENSKFVMTWNDKSISDISGELMADLGMGADPVNAQQTSIQRQENITKNNVNVNIKDPNNNATVTDGFGRPIPATLPNFSY